MSHSRVTLNIAINMDAFTEAMRKLAKAACKIAEAMTRLSPETRRAIDLLTRRNEHGGNGRDAAEFPEQWQSSACSGWLHESCRSDAHDLACTCSCHGRRS